MPIRVWGTYVPSCSTASALASSNRNSVCAQHDWFTTQMKARRDAYEVHIKNTLLNHPKTQWKCTHRLPRCLFLCIISISLQSCIRHQIQPGTTTKYLILWILEAFPHILGDAFLHMLFREAEEDIKLRLAMKSNANKAKASCWNPLQVQLKVFDEMLGLGKGQCVNNDKRKTALTSGYYTETDSVPVTLDRETRTLSLLSQ